MNDYDVLRTHSDNLTILSQSGDVKASTSRSIMPPAVLVHQFSSADIFNKSIKRDSSLFSNFKHGKFWYK